MDISNIRHQIQEEDSRLLNILIRVVNANKGKVEKWDSRLGRAEGLATKCFHHVTTAYSLLRGTKISEQGIDFIDASTIQVATRAALESVLVFGYIYTLPKNEEEGDLAYYSWIMRDILLRKNIKPFDEESRMTKKEDRETLKKCRSKLLGNKYFLKLSARKKKALERDWKLDGWMKIARKMGFDKKLMDRTYSFLCSYSHSGYLSILQIQTAIRKKHRSPPLKGTIGTLRIILANMIDLYCIVFPFSREELYKDRSDVSLVGKHLYISGHNVLFE